MGKADYYKKSLKDRQRSGGGEGMAAAERVAAKVRASNAKRASETKSARQNGPSTRAKVSGMKGMSKVRPKGPSDVESTPINRPSGEVKTSKLAPKTSPRPKARDDKKKKRGAYNLDFSDAGWGR